MLTSPKNNLLGLLIWTPILTLSLAGVSFPVAYAQDKCQRELAEAETKYQDSLFDEVIGLLLNCLNKDGLTVEESEQAYKLLAKAYHARQLLKESKEALTKLLHLVPNWKPNPATDAPPFQRLAEEVIKEVEQERKRREEEAQRKTLPAEPSPTVPSAKKGGGKKWLWIGGGGLVAAGVTVAILSGGGGATDLPDPPGRPR